MKGMLWSMKSILMRNAHAIVNSSLSFPFSTTLYHQSIASNSFPCKPPCKTTQRDMAQCAPLKIKQWYLSPQRLALMMLFHANSLPYERDALDESQDDGHKKKAKEKNYVQSKPKK